MKRFTSAVFFLLFSSALFAQPYVIGGLSTLSFGSDHQANSGYTVGAGYKLNQYFSAEAAYNDLSSGGFHSPTTVSGATRVSDSKLWEGNSVSIAALGVWPTGNNVSVLGKLAAHHVNSTTKQVTTTFDSTTGALLVSNSTTSDQSFWAPSIGIGVQYDAGRFGVRGMLERVQSNSLPSNMTTFSLNALWYFK